MSVQTEEDGIKLACCFAGPRPQSLSFGFNEENADCLRLKQVLKDQTVYLIEGLGVTHFISGIDLGIGQYAAEIVLDLKRDYPEITLECAISCESQAENWSVSQRERYFSIVGCCDKETLLQRHKTRDCNRKRKEYMVNQSDYILTVWNRKVRGASDILSIARQMEKQVIVIDPNTFEVHSEYKQR